MTTLADMTPEHQADCVGMWCDYESAMGTHQAIYEDSRRAAEAVLFEPGFGYFEYDPAKITPRHDLPRAWQPDGTSVDGEWMFVALERSPRDGSVTAGGEFLTLEEARTWAGDHPHRTVDRRFVGEWEEE